LLLIADGHKGYVEKVGARSIAAQVLTTTLDSFFCAMIAAITLKMLDPFGTGKLVLFQVTYDKVGLSFP